MTLFNRELPRIAAFRTENGRAAPDRAATAAEIARIERRARALRAAVLEEMARGLGGALANAWRGLAGRIAAKRQRGRETAALAGMTDHELSDIGVTRADLWRLAD